jgi:hypothetical protein
MPLFAVVTLEKLNDNLWERKTYVVEATSRAAAAGIIEDPSNAICVFPREDRTDLRVISITEESLP